MSNLSEYTEDQRLHCEVTWFIFGKPGVTQVRLLPLVNEVFHYAHYTPENKLHPMRLVLVFVKEIETALRDGRLYANVHLEPYIEPYVTT